MGELPLNYNYVITIRDSSTYSMLVKHMQAHGHEADDNLVEEACFKLGVKGLKMHVISEVNQREISLREQVTLTPFREFMQSFTAENPNHVYILAYLRGFCEINFQPHDEVMKNIRREFFGVRWTENTYNRRWTDYLNGIPVQAIVHNETYKEQATLEIFFNMRIVLLIFLWIEQKESHALSDQYTRFFAGANVSIINEEHIHNLKEELYQVVSDLLSKCGIPEGKLPSIKMFERKEKLGQFEACDLLIPFAIKKILCTYKTSSLHSDTDDEIASFERDLYHILTSKEIEFDEYLKRKGSTSSTDHKTLQDALFNEVETLKHYLVASRLQHASSHEELVQTSEALHHVMQDLHLSEQDKEYLLHQIDQLKEEIEDHKTQRKSIAENLDTITSQLKLVTTESRTVTEMIKKQELQLKHLEGEAARFKISTKNYREKLIGAQISQKEAKKQLEREQRSGEKLTEKLKQAEEQHAVLVRGLEDKVSEKQGEIDKLTERINAQPIENSETQRTKAKLKQLQESFEETQEELKTVKKQRDIELKNHREVLDQHRVKHEKSRAEIDSLQQEVAKIPELQSETQRSRRIRVEKAEELYKKQKEMDILKQQLASTKQSLESEKQSKIGIDKKYRELLEEKGRLEEELKRNMSESRNYASQFEHLINDVAEKVEGTETRQKLLAKKVELKKQEVVERIAQLEDQVQNLTRGTEFSQNVEEIAPILETAASEMTAVVQDYLVSSVPSTSETSEENKEAGPSTSSEQIPASESSQSSKVAFEGQVKTLLQDWAKMKDPTNNDQEVILSMHDEVRRNFNTLVHLLENVDKAQEAENAQNVEEQGLSVASKSESSSSIDSEAGPEASIQLENPERPQNAVSPTTTGSTNGAKKGDAETGSQSSFDPDKSDGSERSFDPENIESSSERLIEVAGSIHEDHPHRDSEKPTEVRAGPLVITEPSEDEVSAAGPRGPLVITEPSEDEASAARPPTPRAEPPEVTSKTSLYDFFNIRDSGLLFFNNDMHTTILSNNENLRNIDLFGLEHYKTSSVTGLSEKDKFIFANMAFLNGILMGVDVTAYAYHALLKTYMTGQTNMPFANIEEALRLFQEKITNLDIKYKQYLWRTLVAKNLESAGLLKDAVFFCYTVLSGKSHSAEIKTVLFSLSMQREMQQQSQNHCFFADVWKSPTHKNHVTQIPAKDYFDEIMPLQGMQNAEQEYSGINLFEGWLDKSQDSRRIENEGPLEFRSYFTETQDGFFHPRDIIRKLSENSYTMGLPRRVSGVEKAEMQDWYKKILKPENELTTWDANLCEHQHLNIDGEIHLPVFGEASYSEDEIQSLTTMAAMYSNPSSALRQTVKRNRGSNFLAWYPHIVPRGLPATCKITELPNLFIQPCKTYFFISYNVLDEDKLESCIQFHDRGAGDALQNYMQIHHTFSNGFPCVLYSEDKMLTFGRFVSGNKCIVRYQNLEHETVSPWDNLEESDFMERNPQDRLRKKRALAFNLRLNAKWYPLAKLATTETIKNLLLEVVQEEYPGFEDVFTSYYGNEPKFENYILPLFGRDRKPAFDANGKALLVLKDDLNPDVKISVNTWNGQISITKPNNFANDRQIPLSAVIIAILNDALQTGMEGKIQVVFNKKNIPYPYEPIFEENSTLLSDLLETILYAITEKKLPFPPLYSFDYFYPLQIQQVEAPNNNFSNLISLYDSIVNRSYLFKNLRIIHRASFLGRSENSCGIVLGLKQSNGVGTIVAYKISEDKVKDNPRNTEMNNFVEWINPKQPTTTSSFVPAAYNVFQNEATPCVCRDYCKAPPDASISLVYLSGQPYLMMPAFSHC